MLTPGVPVESGLAALPLTEISTCCLGAASACFIFWQKSIRPSQTITSVRCVRVHTHCARKMHALTYTNTNRKPENNDAGPLLDVFWRHTKCKDRKESFDRKRECDSVYSETLYFWHLRVRQCYWSLLWRQGQNNNQGLFLKNTEESQHKMFFLIENKLVLSSMSPHMILHTKRHRWSLIFFGRGGCMHKHRLPSSRRSLFSPTAQMLCLRLFLRCGIWSWSRLLLFISHHQARCGVIVKSVGQQSL